MSDNGSRSCDQHPAHETPVTGPDDESRCVCRRDPGEHGYCGCRDEGDQDEDGFDAGASRGEEVRYCAPEGGGAVGDGDKVEGEAGGGVESGAGVSGDVEDRDVVSEHDAGHGEREKHEGEMSQGFEFDEASRAGFLAWSTAKDSAGNEGEEEVNECDAADAPGEVDDGLDLAEEDWKYDATDAGSDRSAADGDGALGGEMRGDDYHCWDICDAATYSDAEALCQKNLVVFCC